MDWYDGLEKVFEVTYCPECDSFTKKEAREK
jgi:hypothetical protein